ncbi:MAG: orotate phosphoribosyltransferase [Planctomycetes bacterium]|nr:orotate phosphoribosyltransferase [Planctomycetota bacterium]
MMNAGRPANKGAGHDRRSAAGKAAEANMIDGRKTAELLLDVGAISIDPAEPFTYASGLRSPIYTDCRLLLSDPPARQAVADGLAESVRRLGVQADAVVAAGVSGIGISALLARRLGLPMCYVRGRAKSHGRRKDIEGRLRPGSRVLLVTDIFSTEPDVPRSISAVRGAGGTIVHCLAVFSNLLGIVEGALDAEGIPYRCLTDVDEVLAAATERGELTATEGECVRHWRADPGGWLDWRNASLEQTIRAAREEVAEILLDIGAVAFSPDEPFTYASGMVSPVYTDNRLLASFPAEWSRVINRFVERITWQVGRRNFDKLAGTATSAISHAAYLADLLGVPMVYVLSEAPGHGTRSRIQGRLRPGERLVVVEDLVTTGASSIATARALRRAGAEVSRCMAIFTYGMPEAREAFAAEGIELLTLCDLEAMLAAAERTGRLAPDQSAAVRRWIADPRAWSAGRAETRPDEK